MTYDETPPAEAVCRPPHDPGVVCMDCASDAELMRSLRPALDEVNERAVRPVVVDWEPGEPRYMETLDERPFEITLDEAERGGH